MLWYGEKKRNEKKKPCKILGASFSQRCCWWCDAEPTRFPFDEYKIHISIYYMTQSSHIRRERNSSVRHGILQRNVRSPSKIFGWYSVAERISYDGSTQLAHLLRLYTHVLFVVVVSVPSLPCVLAILQKPNQFLNRKKLSQHPSIHTICAKSVESLRMKLCGYDFGNAQESSVADQFVWIFQPDWRVFSHSSHANQISILRSRDIKIS